MIYLLKTCFTPPRRPGTAEQAEALQELQQEVGVDFWLEPVLGRAVDIRVAPEQVDFFDSSELHSLFTGRRPTQVFQPLWLES